MAILPLTGVRVLDLGRMIAAPWCTQLLGDLGAEVIKVERPLVGDDMRGYGPPFLKGKDGAQDDSPYHVAVNRNKRSITVDISTPDGADIIRDLAKISDVFVENYKVGDIKRFSLDYESLHKLNPALIYCSVTGFGQTGPSAHRPGLDSLFQAMTGLMSMTGDADGPPQKVGVAISDFVAGMYATVGVLAALRAREVQAGPGQQIDVALLDSTLAAFTNRAQTYLVSGETPGRSGASTPGNQPAGLYRCADGDMILSAGADRQFVGLAKAVNRSEWVDDPRFQTRALRVLHEAALTEALNATLSTAPRAHWLKRFEAAGVMAAPINTVAEAFADPQVLHRKVVVEVEHPRAGPVPMVANPIRFSQTPLPTPKMSPDLGAHTEDILMRLLGRTPEQLQQLKAAKAI